MGISKAIVLKSNRNHFVSKLKLCIMISDFDKQLIIEEADESKYWLEIIEGTKINCDREELTRLLKEIEEIVAIVTKAR
mgnify:CR=1 FL=1